MWSKGVNLIEILTGLSKDKNLSLVQLQCYQQSQTKLMQKNFINNTGKIGIQKIPAIITFSPVLNSLYNIPVS